MPPQKKSPSIQFYDADYQRAQELFQFCHLPDSEALVCKQKVSQLSVPSFYAFCIHCFEVGPQDPVFKRLHSLVLDDPRFDPLVSVSRFTHLHWQQVLSGNRRVFSWAAQHLGSAGSAQWCFDLLKKTGPKKELLRLIFKSIIHSSTKRTSRFPALDSSVEHLSELGFDLNKEIPLIFPDSSPLTLLVPWLFALDTETRISAKALLKRLVNANRSHCLALHNQDSDALSTSLQMPLHFLKQEPFREEIFHFLVDLGFDIHQCYPINLAYHDPETGVPLCNIFSKHLGLKDSPALLQSYLNIMPYLNPLAKDDQGRSALTCLSEGCQHDDQDTGQTVAQAAHYLLNHGLHPEDVAPQPSLESIVSNSHLLRVLQVERERLDLLSTVDSTLLNEALEIAKHLQAERELKLPKKRTL